MIRGSHLIWHLFPKTILTILKSTPVSKTAGLDSLPGHFVKDRAKFLVKPVSHLCNLSINSEKFPDSCKVAKIRPLYKKVSLTQPCSYRPISLLSLISKVIEKIIHDQTSTFLNSKQLLYTYLIWFSKKAFYRFLPFLSE